MENQHRKISGYRELSQEEINAMNNCKVVEMEVANLTKLIRSLPDTDQRAAALAVTNFQQGFMWLVRSIAKPADQYVMPKPQD
jgi:hypothetical protein